MRNRTSAADLALAVKVTDLSTGSDRILTPIALQLPGLSNDGKLSFRLTISPKLLSWTQWFRHSLKPGFPCFRNSSNCNSSKSQRDELCNTRAAAANDSGWGGDALADGGERAECDSVRGFAHLRCGTIGGVGRSGVLAVARSGGAGDSGDALWFVCGEWDWRAAGCLSYNGKVVPVQTEMLTVCTQTKVCQSVGVHRLVVQL